MSARSPVFYAGLSIVTSIFTIVVKFMAYSLTGSVGLLSDALESFVRGSLESAEDLAKYTKRSQRGFDPTD